MLNRLLLLSVSLFCCFCYCGGSGGQDYEKTVGAAAISSRTDKDGMQHMKTSLPQNSNHEPDESFLQKENDKIQRCDVIIVGAGAAGLVCAHDLLKQKTADGKHLSVVILEARNRLGGRINSVQEERTHVDGKTKVSFIVDHGAAWVHGTGVDWPKPRTSEEKKSQVNSYENPMMSLLQQLTPLDQNVCYTHLNPIFEVGNPWMRPLAAAHAPENMVLYVSGKRIPASCDLIDQAVKRHFSIMQVVSKIGQAMFNSGNGMDTAEFSLEQIVCRILSSPEYSVKLLDRDGPDDPLVESIVPFYRYLIECWYACPARDLPLSMFVLSDSDTENEGDDESRWNDWDADYYPDGDFYGPHCTLPNGMKTVLEPLLNDRVKDCIQYNQEVVSIRSDGDSVFVTTRTGAQLETNMCVVTMSIGCLQHSIKETSMFEPPLGPEKREAIFARRMGGYKKVFLTFDRIFWPCDEPLLGLIRNTKDDDSSGIGNYLLLDNLWARDGIPCLEAVLFGQVAMELSPRTDEEIKNEVLVFLENAMGEKLVHEYCVDCHVTRWEEDPYSRGAYSSYKLGTMERHAEELIKPEWNGKLLLAGEAGNPEHEGSVHGALMSGLETAETIRSVLNRF